MIIPVPTDMEIISTEGLITLAINSSYYVFNKRHCHLIYLLTPEYQAAARLVLTTTSTGTRSARALLEDLKIMLNLIFTKLYNTMGDYKNLTHFSVSKSLEKYYLNNYQKI